MRITGGTAARREIHAPKSGLRPTMDRVRAAVFSSLADAVPEARVLDLFAGTGSLGIEALSRGAASAVFVDQSEIAIAAIRKNLAALGMSASVQAMDVWRFLSLYAGEESYDLVFADPPYATAGEDCATRLMESRELRTSLVPDGILVLERRAAKEDPFADGWQIVRRKRYGASEVLFLRPDR